VTVGKGEVTREVLVMMFDHYALMGDKPDLTNMQFQNEAARVVGELWVRLSRNKLHLSINRINWIFLKY
jgi:hypothetical protein